MSTTVSGAIDLEVRDGGAGPVDMDDHTPGDYLGGQP